MDNREFTQSEDEKELEELLPQQLRWMKDTLTPLDGDITLPKSLTGAALLARFAGEIEAEEQGPQTGDDQPTHPTQEEKVVPFPTRRFVRYAAGAAAALLLVIGVSRILPGLGTPPPSTASSSQATDASGDSAPGNYAQSYTQLRRALGGADEAPAGEPRENERLLQAAPTPQSGPLMAGNGASPDTIGDDEAAGTETGTPTPRAAAFTAGGPRVTNVSTGTGGEQSTQSDDGFIYTLRETGRGQEVLIVDASELAVVSHLEIDENSSIQGLLLSEDQLVLIDRTGSSIPPSTQTVGEVTENIYPNYNATAAIPLEPAMQVSCGVEIYDISDRQNPSLTKRYEQDGDYLTAHVEENTLYLVSYKEVTADVRADSTGMGELVPSVEATPLAPKDILLGENQAYENYVLISAYSMEEIGQSSSVALLGDTRMVQLEGNSLYLAADDGENSQLTALTLQKGRVVPGGTASLEGLLLEGTLSRGAGVLRLITQSGQGDPAPRFYLLGEQLELLGSITDIAPGERVQGIAYLGEDTAYLSTYLEKESVAVLDLKDPKAPKILGRLENPLSASVLTPLGENRYLAVGDGPEESQRAVVVDCSNPMAPKVYGEVTFTGKDGPPYSQARFLKGAVAVDENEKHFAIPIYGADLGGESSFGGYLLYDYSTQTLTQLAAIGDSLSSARGHFQDGRFYTLTEDGMAIWDGEGTQGKTLQF